MSSKTFNSNGKLLLFGEYAVLDGAKSLALPCRLGQSLEIKPHRGSDLIWEAYDENNNLWFEAQISLYDFSSVRTSDAKTSRFVQKLLKGAVRQNTEFLNKWNGFKSIHRLEFSRNWGLGTSSTVINNVAQWADVNPFHLHFSVSTGSGYDIACAAANGPIVYQLSEDQLDYSEVDFNPSFREHLYFVYLGNKTISSKGIALYSKEAKKRKSLANKISELTEEALQCEKLEDFRILAEEHEAIISKEIKLEKIKTSRFSDFPGTVKSLGAWGGDFILAITEEPWDYVKSYFTDKGCDTMFQYDDLILADKVNTEVMYG